MEDGGTVIVRVVQGELRGRRRRSAWGFPFFSFQGIPYAAPPVGPLRFKPPQPPSSWTGVRDATKEGSVAAQLNRQTGQFEGDEDCLFLNVYTPRLPANNSGGLLPVMFLIHGGGLAATSGNEDRFGPDFLVQQGVLLLTINYRLSVLGFLSTGDEVVPGNMGFKDQVMALRWVRNNIKSFCGDPDNVTIFGSSSGGWSCHAHILSSMSRGLFRRVIAQSGVAVSEGTFTQQVRVRSFALAAHLGLRTKDPSELVEFLRRQPARVLQENALHGRTEEDMARGVPFPFVGTVEPAGAEGGTFLSRDPADILRSGDFQPVPLITGVCAFEGLLFAPGFLPGTKLLSGGSESSRLLIPTNLQCPEGDRSVVAEQIRQFYFGDQDVGPETKTELLTLIGDVMFAYPAVRVAKRHSELAASRVYFYIFDVIRKHYAEGGAAANMIRIMKEANAAGHGAELGFLFNVAALGDAPRPASEDGNVISSITRCWTNFAKTGNPTASGEHELGVSWPAYTAETEAYLYVDSKGLTVSLRPFADRVAFWEKLYKHYEA